MKLYITAAGRLDVGLRHRSKHDLCHFRAMIAASSYPPFITYMNKKKAAARHHAKRGQGLG